MKRTVILLTMLTIFCAHLLSQDNSNNQIYFDPESGEIINSQDNREKKQSEIVNKISAYDYLEKLAHLTNTNAKNSLRTTTYMLYGFAIVSSTGILLDGVVSEDQRVQVGMGFSAISILGGLLSHKISKTYISPPMVALNLLNDLDSNEKDESALEALINLVLNESSINNKISRSLLYRNGRKPINYTATYALDGYYKQVPIDEHYSPKNIFFRSLLFTY